MWGDFEVRNKFLEDLLLEYGTKLDAMNSRLEASKREVADLKRQVEYYQRNTGGFIGDIYREPDIMEVPNGTNNIVLYLKNSPATVELTDERDNYHVVAKMIGNNTIAYKYLISKLELASAKDIYGILSYLHKKVLNEMERRMKNLT